MNIYQRSESLYFRTELGVSVVLQIRNTKLIGLDVSQLLGSDNYYGSYQVLGNLSVTIASISDSTTNYKRSLDLSTGLHNTTFSSNGSVYSSVVACSYPDDVCFYSLTSTNDLPEITVALENQLVDPALQTESCGSDYVRLTGYTQLGPPLGMKYDAIAKITAKVPNAYCSNSTTGTLVIPSSPGIKSFSVVIGAGTDYDQKKGNAASNFSFKGEDPGGYVEAVTSSAASKQLEELISDGMLSHAT
jgi:alpha-L-fucosidase 2